jgi:hypothetical protein
MEMQVNGHVFRDPELARIAAIARDLNLRMEDPAPTGDPAPTPPAPTPTPTPPAPTPPAPSETPEQTIERLNVELRKTREEVGKERVTAKQNAADAAKKELAETLGKALGFIPDELLDPEKLKVAKEAADAIAKQSQVEVAIFRAADPLNANASALLDSRSFLAKVSTIDPSDKDALTAVITEAVTENPLLLKTTDPSKGPPMRPNPAQGGSAGGGPSLNDQIAMAIKEGRTRDVVRLKSAAALQPK